MKHQIDELLDTLPRDEQPTAVQASNGNGQYKPFDMPEFLARNGLRVKEIKQDGSYGTKYILNECPNDPSHKAPDSYVAVMPSGALVFHCSHNSCATYRWQELRERFEPGYRNKPRELKSSTANCPHQTGDLPESSEQSDSHRIEYQSLTLADLKVAPDPVYLIDGILELSQPGVIAGQYKSLKTTLALELSYSLVTGADFLGCFKPNRQARVGMFSGEAGPAQLKGTIQRIAKFHGDDDPWKHEGLILSCERLPRIGSLEYMDALVRWIGKHSLELCIIDPGYAALAAVGDVAGNYYRVAELLFQVTDLQKKTGCIILLAPHMTKAPKYDPPMLSDIQWSGFSEWCGQWLLLGKRLEWDDQTGQHWLWLVAGGRSGHASTWGLDVTEGRQDDLGGKVFEVELITKDAAFGTSNDAQRRQRERSATNEQQESEEAIRRAFRSLGAGWHIKAHVLERTGTSGRGRAVIAAWAAMLRKREIRVSEGACRGANNKPTDGYSIHPKD